MLINKRGELELLIFFAACLLAPSGGAAFLYSFPYIFFHPSKLEKVPRCPKVIWKHEVKVRERDLRGH